MMYVIARRRRGETVDVRVGVGVLQDKMREYVGHKSLKKTCPIQSVHVSGSVTHGALIGAGPHGTDKGRSLLNIMPGIRNTEGKLLSFC